MAVTEARKVARQRLNAVYAAGAVIISVAIALLTYARGWLAGEQALLGSAGACVWFALVISLHGISLHVLAGTNSSEESLFAQRWSLRFAWLGPVYSLSALSAMWCTLAVNCGGPSARQPSGSYIVADTTREVYEAYGVLAFVSLMRELVNRENLASSVAEKPAKQWMHPFRSGRPVGPHFLDWVEGVAVDYVLVQIVTSLISAVAVWADGPSGIYGAGMLLDPSRLYPYLVLLKFFQQSWAIWSFVQLYRHLKDILPPHYRVDTKFLTLKALIVLLWWQDVILSLFVSLWRVPDYVRRCTSDQGESLQREALSDWLVTVQMVPLSFAIHFSFSWADFQAVESEGREDVEQREEDEGRVDSSRIRQAVGGLFTLEDVNAEMGERMSEWATTVARFVRNLKRVRERETREEGRETLLESGVS
jgi:hypothetical protein